MSLYDVILLLLSQEPTFNVSWCVDRCDDPDDKPMHCKHHKHIQIRDVDVLRANSDTSYENIDEESWHQCKRLNALRRTIRSRCNGKHICRNGYKYRDWNECPGHNSLSSRPIEVEIVFDCVSRKYIFSATDIMICIYDTINREHKVQS